VQELQPVQVLESVPAQEPQLEQVLVQELVLQPVQVLESEPAQEPQLVQAQVQHPLHQPPQSPFQLQPSRLQQREFR